MIPNTKIIPGKTIFRKQSSNSTVVNQVMSFIETDIDGRIHNAETYTFSYLVNKQLKINDNKGGSN